MAMRSSRVTWRFCLALLGAAAISLAVVGAPRALADEWGVECIPGFYAETDVVPVDDLQNEVAPAPPAHIDPIDEADHFDTGPVWDAPTLTSEETATADDAWQGTDYETEYYYEYPEDREESCQQLADETDYVEEYYYKYGYQGDYGTEANYDEHSSDEAQYDYDDDYCEEQYKCEYASDEFEPTECPEYAYDYDEWETESSEYQYDGEYLYDDFQTSDAVEGTDEWDYTYDEYEYDYASESTTDEYEPYECGEWKYDYDEYEYDHASESTTDEYEAYESDKWEYEYGEYEYDYASESTTDEYEPYECDEWKYDYDEYEYDYASESTTEDYEAYECDEWEYDYASESTTDEYEPYESDEWKYDYGEYEYDYASESTTDEYEAYECDEWEYDYASESTTDEYEAYESDKWEYEYGEYEYDYASESMTDEYEPYGCDEWEYDYDEYEYDHASESTMDKYEPYECDEWEYDYGEYEYDYATEPMTDEYETYGDAEAAMEEAVDTSDEWETASEADEWQYEYVVPEERYGYPDYMSGNLDSEDFGDHETSEWQDYSEAYPYKEYAYPNDSMEEVEDSGSDDFSYYDESGYGYEPDYYDYESEGVVAEEYNDSELFAWHPSELLLFADREVLRTLETLGSEPSGVRRATLNDYLEALGWEAIAFASRFEDVAGIEVLGLADDLPGAAAFLAVFRLVEQGELGMDEAVDLLERSLENLSLDWIEGVREMTAGGFEEWDARSAAGETDGLDWSDAGLARGPVFDVIVSLAARSLASLGSALCGVSEAISEVDWERAVAAAAESRAAGNYGVRGEPLQR